MHYSCQYTHSVRGGSASLLTHLKTKHPNKLNENVQGKSTNRALENYYTPLPQKEKPKIEPITHQGFKEKLIAFIIDTNQAFSVVESKRFIDLIAYCSGQNQYCNIVKRTQTTNWVTELYGEEKTNLKTELKQNAGKVSFILDGWTSPNQKAFLGIIACWITDEWELRHAPLDLAILEGEHSGENIASAFAAVLDDYDLWDKMLGVTTDNASNNDTMFVELDKKSRDNMVEFNSKEHRVRCLAHILNLSCKAALQCVNQERIPDGCENSTNANPPTEKVS